MCPDLWFDNQIVLFFQVEYGVRDGLGIPKDAVKKGDRVLLIDDLVATGASMSLTSMCS
jgi:adenine/guanine phosphoribosyltransferase-like PRPP-binding protein